MRPSRVEIALLLLILVAFAALPLIAPWIGA